MMHRLKTDREPFEAVLRGDKTFEFRLNDREFSPGDTVILDCWNDETDHVVNVDPITAEIGFVLFGPNYGVPEDYCVISLLNPRTASGPCRTSATGGGDRG